MKDQCGYLKKTTIRRKEYQHSIVKYTVREVYVSRRTKPYGIYVSILDVNVRYGRNEANRSHEIT